MPYALGRNPVHPSTSNLMVAPHPIRHACPMRLARLLNTWPQPIDPPFRITRDKY